MARCWNVGLCAGSGITREREKDEDADVDALVTGSCSPSRRRSLAAKHGQKREEGRGEEGGE